MSEILCRIDPEDMYIEYGMDDYHTLHEFIKRYITAHAVPETQAPVLFGGVEYGEP